MVYPTKGDHHYLQLLLTHARGRLSVSDLLTINGIQCNTFKEVAEHRSLFENDIV